jgi:hypothetical protein
MAFETRIEGYLETPLKQSRSDERSSGVSLVAGEGSATTFHKAKIPSNSKALPGSEVRVEGDTSHLDVSPAARFQERHGSSGAAFLPKPSP